MKGNAQVSPSPQPGTIQTLSDLGVIVVAAGRGERLGAGIPKAFVELGGMTLLEHSVRTVASLPHHGHLVLVVPGDHAAEALEITDEVVSPDSNWAVSVVAGGRERHESVRFGLDVLHESVTTVLVHDAARPLASGALFERVIAAVRSSGHGVVPALPVVDTLKRIDSDGVVHETVDRSALVAVQTPQGFPREPLAAAHATVQLQDSDVTQHHAIPTDDAEVLQRSGGLVSTVAGESQALKVTTPHDLLALEAILSSQMGSHT